MMTIISRNTLISFITTHFSGLIKKECYGETTFFYNPEGLLSHGTYFCTIKEKDGPHDKASNLSQENTYRLNCALSFNTFKELFNTIPPRPIKGTTISENYDFTSHNVLMPHPIYGWMRWVCITNPTTQSLPLIKKALQESYTLAVTNYEKRINKKKLKDGVPDRI